MKRLLQHAGLTSKEALWCLWGAALALVPYVLRCDAIALYWTHMRIVPLQASLPAVAVAFLAAVLSCLFARRPRRSPRFGVWAALAVVTVLPVLLCELGWLPMRLGNLVLVEYEPLFDVIGGIAQTIGFAAWLFLGLSLARGREDAHLPESCAEASSLFRLRVSVFAVCSLGPASMLALVGVIPGVGLGLSLFLCVLSALGVGAGCLRLVRLRPVLQEMKTLMVCALGGLLMATMLREGLSSLLFFGTTVLSSNSVLVDESLQRGLVRTVIVSVLYVAGVFGVCFAVLRNGKSKSSTAVVATEQQSEREEAVEAAKLRALLSLPHAETLSPRERQVLVRVALGWTNARIAEALSVQAGTASDYRRRGFAKLGVASKQEFVAALRANESEEAAERDVRPHAAPVTKRDGTALAAPVYAAIVVLATLFKPPYSCWRALCVGVGLLVLGVGLVRVLSQTSGLCMRERDGEASDIWPMVAQEGMALATAMVSAVGLCNLWSSYMPALMGFIPLDIMAALAFGLRRGSLVGKKGLDACRGVGGALMKGGSSLLMDSLGVPLVIGASIALEPMISNLFYGRINTYSWISVTIASVYACCVSLRDSRTCLKEAREGDDLRAFLYLEGRGLGKTEAKVVLMTARGATRAEICSSLFISPGTVNSHRAHGYAQLGVHSRDELAQLLERDAGLLR